MNLYIAIPAMNELGYLEKTLESLKLQTLQSFTVFICVNQPESYSTNPEKQFIYQNNQHLLKVLANFSGLNLKILDNSSIGKGWTGKLHGVGQARKVLMDAIVVQASDDDLIISLDADTLLPVDYFQSVKNVFTKNKKALGLAAPYLHKLTGDEQLDRSILHYEIYMRHYLLNLFRIKSPYSFTALGSALAVTVKSYKKIGGMTPKLSGEDFYFLQKIKKCGELVVDLPCSVYPAARYSDRVFFGTGPALIKGSAGDWNSYPIYSDENFEKIAETYRLLPELYTLVDVKTPLDEFLTTVFKEQNVWQPLRANNKKMENFVKACHEKLDGLRVLQFLKEQNNFDQRSDEEKFAAFLLKYYPDASILTTALSLKDFRTSPVADLELIRDFLYNQELIERQKIGIL